MDSYEKFIEWFNIDKSELYRFGLEETIFPDIKLVDKSWEDLKRRIYSNEVVSIRGYGRDAHGTQLYINLYNYIFNNKNVVKDPTNNFKPQKIISELTGYKRNKNLFNYQVSHIFGHTKNIFLFECPWNIVFMPKIMDPFTGHEAKGDWPKEFQKLFLESSYFRYEKYINDYNEIIRNIDVEKKVQEYVDMLVHNKTELTEKILKQFCNDAKKELSPIVFQN